MALRGEAVPAGGDNYAHILFDEGSREAVIIDPSSAGPVRAAAGRLGVRPAGILLTHHHSDHTGGAPALASEYKCGIMAHEEDAGRIGGVTTVLRGGEEIPVGEGSAEIVHVPGHTRGHIAAVAGELVFTGDAYFLAGSGRLFEGTAAESFESIFRLLSPLPDTALIFPGHEYTVKNLEFALSLIPNDAPVRDRLASIRGGGGSAHTVPADLGTERRTNPFLRVADPAYREMLRGRRIIRDDDPVEAFAAIRRLRDRF